MSNKLARYSFTYQKPNYSVPTTNTGTTFSKTFQKGRENGIISCNDSRKIRDRFTNRSVGGGALAGMTTDTLHFSTRRNSYGTRLYGDLLNPYQDESKLHSQNRHRIHTKPGVVPNNSHNNSRRLSSPEEQYVTHTKYLKNLSLENGYSNYNFQSNPHYIQTRKTCSQKKGQVITKQSHRRTVSIMPKLKDIPENENAVPQNSTEDPLISRLYSPIEYRNKHKYQMRVDNNCYYCNRRNDKNDHLLWSHKFFNYDNPSNYFHKHLNKNLTNDHLPPRLPKPRSLSRSYQNILYPLHSKQHNSYDYSVTPNAARERLLGPSGAVLPKNSKMNRCAIIRDHEHERFYRQRLPYPTKPRNNMTSGFDANLTTGSKHNFSTHTNYKFINTNETFTRNSAKDYRKNSLKGSLLNLSHRWDGLMFAKSADNKVNTYRGYQPFKKRCKSPFLRQGCRPSNAFACLAIILTFILLASLWPIKNVPSSFNYYCSMPFSSPPQFFFIFPWCNYLSSPSHHPLLVSSVITTYKEEHTIQPCSKNVTYHTKIHHYRGHRAWRWPRRYEDVSTLRNNNFTEPEIFYRKDNWPPSLSHKTLRKEDPLHSQHRRTSNKRKRRHSSMKLDSSTFVPAYLDPNNNSSRRQIDRKEAPLIISNLLKQYFGLLPPHYSTSPSSNNNQTYRAFSDTSGTGVEKQLKSDKTGIHDHPYFSSKYRSYEHNRYKVIADAAPPPSKEESSPLPKKFGGGTYNEILLSNYGNHNNGHDRNHQKPSPPYSVTISPYHHGNVGNRYDQSEYYEDEGDDDYEEGGYEDETEYYEYYDVRKKKAIGSQDKKISKPQQVTKKSLSQVYVKGIPGGADDTLSKYGIPYNVESLTKNLPSSMTYADLHAYLFSAINKKQHKFHSRNSYTLQIAQDGTVNGTIEQNSEYTLFQITSIGSYSAIQLYGVKTKRYVCMNQFGKLHSIPNGKAKPHCTFVKSRFGQHYFTLYSVVPYPMPPLSRNIQVKKQSNDQQSSNNNLTKPLAQEVKRNFYVALDKYGHSMPGYLAHRNTKSSQFFTSYH